MKLGAFATTRDEALCVCDKEYLLRRKSDRKTLPLLSSFNELNI